jgi:hypothetical protein
MTPRDRHMIALTFWGAVVILAIGALIGFFFAPYIYKLLNH